MRLILLLLISLAAITLGFARLSAKVFDADQLFKQKDIETFSPINGISSVASDQQLVRFALSRDYADHIFNSNLKLITIDNFPVSPEEHLNVRLRMVNSAFDERTQWFGTNDAGEEVSADAPRVIVYKGEIDGVENSEIVLVYSEGFLNCSIKRAAGVYYDMTTSEKDIITLTPYDFKFKVGGKSLDFEPLQELTAKVDKHEDHFLADTAADFTKLLEAKVAIDATYRFYLKMNSDYQKAAAYIASVMSYVSLIYERDLNVRITVPTVLIRTNQLLDPYGGAQGDKIEDDLNKMPDLWKKKRAGDIASVCLFANFNYAAGGLSRFDAPGKALLCDRDWSYSVVGLDANSQYPNYDYTWDVNVTAHEIGHIFGAPHTHVCYYNPPIDTCATRPSIADACLTGEPVRNRGTIMSYCHLINGAVELVFHPRQIPQMRKSALAAACLKASLIPYINITGPVAKRIFEPNQEINILWSFSGVAKVNLYYSTNEGDDWVEIAKNVPPELRTYKWKAPGAPTDKIILKITASENETIWDVSDAYITVMIPSIIITQPKVGDEYGEKETALFRWEAPLTETVNVYFSADGGRTWKTLKSSIEAIGLYVKLKGIISDNCLVKVEDAGRPWLVAVSPVFKVGETSFRFLEPKAGDTVCSAMDYFVRWESKYLYEFTLERSLDGGNNWESVDGTSIRGKTGVYKWTVPPHYYPDVKLRATVGFHFDKSRETVGISETFSIFPCGPDSIHAVKILFVAPNPASDEATVTIQSASGAALSIAVYNSIGGLAVPEVAFTAESALSSRNINLKGLAQGSYFVVARVGEERAVYPIAVIK